MGMSGGKLDGEPMMDMNMTPLIDVLLVLPPQDIVVDPVKNKLVLSQADQILWNGTPVDSGQLVTLLAETTRMSVEPELQFEPEAMASYDITAKVRSRIS